MPRQISGRVCLSLEQIEQGDDLLDPKQEDQGEEMTMLSSGDCRFQVHRACASAGKQELSPNMEGSSDSFLGNAKQSFTGY